MDNRERAARWRRKAVLCQTQGLRDDRAMHRAIVYNECAEELEAEARAAIEGEPPRKFPIQKATPIPWSLAERAYRTYAEHYGRQQSLERLAERGGFGWSEFLHLYYGDTTYAKKEEMQARWDADELAQTKLRIAELERVAPAPARDGVREAIRQRILDLPEQRIGSGNSTWDDCEPIIYLRKRDVLTALAAKEQADGQAI